MQKRSPAAVKKKVAKATPKLLAGGNPQITKGDGNEPVQAYISALPGWKREVGLKLDTLIDSAVPGVRKAVRWNSPFYGVEGKGWFLSFHCATKYIKVAFFRGASLHPLPPVESKDKEVRYLHIQQGEWDEKQFIRWIKQASKLEGWDGSPASNNRTGNSAGSTQRLRFSARLNRLTDEMEYFGLDVPKSITQKIGILAAVPVIARINGSSPYSTSLYPLGEGRHGMRIKASVRKEAQASEGDQVQVEIEVLNRTQKTQAPADLLASLRSQGLLAAFEAMPPGMSNFLLRKIEEAARPETRKKRIEEVLSAAEKRREKSSSKRK